MANSLPREGARKRARTRLWREAFVRHHGEILIGRVFAFLKAHLGESEARRFFDRFSTRRSPQSKRRGSANSARDVELLIRYDNAAAGTANEGSVPRQLAARLHESDPGKYGASTEAIEKHIRRLLKKRDQKEQAQAEMDREMRAILNEQEGDLQKLRRSALQRKRSARHDSAEKSTDK